MSLLSPGNQGCEDWFASLPSSELDLERFLCHKVRGIPVPLVPSREGALNAKNPKLLQRCLTTSHFKEI